MKLEKITLENFKCYEKETFEFDESFTVLIGDNGKGKTTILDAIAILLGAYFQSWDTPTGQRTINKKDVRRVNYIKKGAFNSEPQTSSTLTGKACIRETRIEWLRSLNDRGKKAKYFVKLGADDRQAVAQGQDIDLPLLVYYGAGRLWEIHRDIKIEKPGSRLDAYRYCLETTSDRKAFEAWFKRLTLGSLQKNKENKFLKIVEEAVLKCLPEGAFKFEYDVDEDELILYFEKEPMQFNKLSSGYRNMVAMVADIAYRACHLNPHLAEKAATESKGIVLIDEIELHLHPRWQRQVVENLKSAFPNLQFIVTTHSPFIIQSLTRNEIIDLNHDAGHQPSLEANSSIEDIIENIQGIPVPQRSYRYQEMYDTAKRYYELLEKSKTVPQAELAQIEAALNQLSAPFSDDVAYHAFLEMKRLASLSERENA
jgi:predicted ATP-binding protein involved in virulence